MAVWVRFAVIASRTLFLYLGYCKSHFFCYIKQLIGPWPSGCRRHHSLTRNQTHSWLATGDTVESDDVCRELLHNIKKSLTIPNKKARNFMAKCLRMSKILLY